MDYSGLISPLELWKDFDPEEGELHITELRTVADGLVVTKKLYFDAYRCGGGVARAYGELRYTRAAFAESNGYLPVVLLIADLYGAGAQDCAWQMTGAGYAVFCMDFSGNEDAPRCTLYPDSLTYAKADFGGGKLWAVATSPKETCWYVWTAMARRAITLLSRMPEVDVSRLGVIGLNEGGNVAASLAALDERLRCSAIFGNTGWRNYGLLYEGGAVRRSGYFDEERAAYNCCISVESYAQFIGKPTLWLIGSNDIRNDFDRAFDTFARLPQGLKCALSVSPRADGSIRYEQLGNLRRWMDRFVLFRGDYYETPELEAYVSANRQYVRCLAKSPEHVQKVDLYYAYNEQDYRIRNWYRADEIAMDEGEWIATLEVSGEDRYVFCFAVVTYDNGVTVSSKQIVARPGDNGVVAPSPASNRLIYESADGIDCFTVANTGGLFDYRSELELAEGPFSIRGIQATVGELATYKLADERYFGFEGDLLGITYYAPSATRVVFKLAFPDGRQWSEFSYALEAEGGEVWQKITLPLGDFKNDQGVSPESWDRVKRFAVARERGQTFLISTLLWV